MKENKISPFVFDLKSFKMETVYFILKYFENLENSTSEIFHFIMR